MIENSKIESFNTAFSVMVRSAMFDFMTEILSGIDRLGYEHIYTVL